MPKNPEREGSPRLITPQQIEQEHGIRRSTLYTYRHRPTFPKPVKVEGSIKTFYRADEVAAWLAANPKQQGKRTDLATREQQGEPMATTVDPRTEALNEAVDALRAKAQELSAMAEEEMRRDLEEQAQVWHEAAEVVRKLKRVKQEASDA